MNAKTTSRDRLAGLDTLRAVAITAVMAFHLNGRLPDSFQGVGQFGWAGVDLFFVLSGYLIGSQLLRPLREGRGVAVADFYRRRAYRILPAYFVVLALYLIWPAWHEADGMSPLWEFVTFTENLFVDYAKNHAFSHVWSLCVEEHFYLLLPLMVLWLVRKPSWKKTIAVVGGVFALGVAFRAYELLHVLRPLEASGQDWTMTYMERIYYPTYSRLDGLLAGVALALVKVFRAEWWAVLRRWANVLLVAGVSLVACALWMFRDRFETVLGVTGASVVIGFSLLSLGLAMLIPGAASVECWLGRWRVPGARPVAMLAFSLYLTHKEVASVLNGLLPSLLDARDWRCVPIYAAGCVIVALALYYAVERPMLMLRDKREGRGAGSVDVEARSEPAL